MISKAMSLASSAVILPRELRWALALARARAQSEPLLEWAFHAEPCVARAELHFGAPAVLLDVAVAVVVTSVEVVTVVETAIPTAGAVALAAATAAVVAIALAVSPAAQVASTTAFGGHTVRATGLAPPHALVPQQLRASAPLGLPALLRPRASALLGQPALPLLRAYVLLLELACLGAVHGLTTIEPLWRDGQVTAKAAQVLVNVAASTNWCPSALWWGALAAT